MFIVAVGLFGWQMYASFVSGVIAASMASMVVGRPSRMRHLLRLGPYFTA